MENIDNDLLAISMYSESHERMKDLFLKTYQQTQTTPLKIKKTDQVVKRGGLYMAEGWRKCMQSKIECILEACDMASSIMYFDIDMAFFKCFKNDIETRLERVDMVFQKDLNARVLCAGQFAFNVNEKTKALLVDILKNIHRFPGDQACLNERIKHHRNIKWELLPETYYCYGQYKPQVWNGLDFTFPQNLKTFHGNWTTGTESKLKILNYAISKNPI